MSEPLKVETAFIMVKGEDGVYTAFTDLTMPIEVNNQPTRQDIKTACVEILDSIRRDDITLSIINQLAQNPLDSIEEANSSIRQALEERDIL
jgi:2-keto-3-deoxy-L-rhamnonate aldolase RhmA